MTPKYFKLPSLESVFRILLMGVILAGLTGCGAKPPASVDAIVSGVITNSIDQPGNPAPLFKAAPPNQTALRWNLHVDVSAAMQGFVNAEEESGKSPYTGLLLDLSNRAKEVSYYASNRLNTPMPPDSQSASRPSAYAGRPVRLAEMIAEFRKKTNQNHIYISSGILTDNGKWNDQTPLKLTAELKAFLATGGDFSLLAQTSPYHSDFYRSVTLDQKLSANADPSRREIALHSPSRPFLIWVFIQPGQSWSVLDTLQFKLSDAKNSPTPTNEAGRFLLLPPCRWSVRPNLSEKALGSAEVEEMVFSAPKQIASDQFEAVEWAEPLSNGDATFAVRVGLKVPAVAQVSVDGWARTNLAAYLSSWPIDSAFAVGPAITRAERIAPKWRLMNSLSEGSHLLQLEWTQPRSRGSGGLHAWMITVRGTEGTTDQHRLWQAFSTEDDSSPTQSGRLFRLSFWLGIIQENLHQEARGVFLTDWP